MTEEKIKVVFVVHFKEVWTGLQPVYRLMTEDPRFDPLVIVIDFSMMGEPRANGHTVAEFLRREGDAFADLTGLTDEEIGGFLAAKRPDYLFRQTPWEGSFPDSLTTTTLVDRNIGLLCVPYNLHIVDHPEYTINQQYMKECALYFCFCEEHFSDYRQKSDVAGANAILTGSPKLDHIVRTCEAAGTGRGADTGRCILWAPHHSVTDRWLRFGSFFRDCAPMLDFARRSQDTKFIFRPHHLLEQIAGGTGEPNDKTFESFRRDWLALPNTTIDRHEDCAPAFAESDLLVTDGISFLAEYQVTRKPLIFIDNAPETPLTPVGRRAKDNATIVRDMHEAIDEIGRIGASVSPDASWLRPFPGQAAARILEAIASDASRNRRA